MRYLTPQIPDNPKWLQANLVTLQVGGSHCYGLNTEESDIDYRGICVPPVEYYLNPFLGFEQSESKNPDMTIFSLTKFFKLCAENNPNVMEILWVNEEFECLIPYKSGLDCIWYELIKNRDLFLSQRAGYSYSGYAMQQLHRIKRHRSWLLNPPQKKPERPEFGLPETATMSKDIVGVIDATEAKGEKYFSDEVMERYAKEKQYLNAVTQWKQYEDWKKNRNPKRAVLEAKAGYDTKHAMHLVRLMRMAEEILGKGEVNVFRQDRTELLAIRNGALTYEELVGYAQVMDENVKALVKTSKLPTSQENKEKLGKLHQKMVEQLL